jgi:hypothetical protein
LAAGAALAAGPALAALLLDPKVEAHPRASRRGTTALLLLLGAAATPSIVSAAVALLVVLLLLAAGLLRGRRRGGGGAARRAAGGVGGGDEGGGRSDLISVGEAKFLDGELVEGTGEVEVHVGDVADGGEEAGVQSLKEIENQGVL